MKKFLAIFLTSIMLLSQALVIVSYATDLPSANFSQSEYSSEKDNSTASMFENKLEFPSETISVPDEYSFLFDEQQSLETSSKFESLMIESTDIFTVSTLKTDIIESIVSNENFVIDGEIKHDNRFYKLDEYYNYNNTSKYHIANWAHIVGLITEEEKLYCYQELLLSKNFENIDCLNNVYDEILAYSSKETENIAVRSSESDENDTIINQKFILDERLRSSPSVTNEKTYTSSNFTIHYDSTFVTDLSAQAIAEYFEKTRTTYINMGFISAILENGKSTYQVYLHANTNPTAAGVCTFFNNSNGNTSHSYIEFFGYGSLTSDLKEFIAHEYFHAIQNSYNTYNTWFKEACANWGKIIVTGTSNTCNNIINTFIASENPLSYDQTKYGAVMYPLTIDVKYGDIAMVYIYEMLSEYSKTMTETEFRQAISRAINQTGTSQGYTEAYRRMEGYLCNTDVWYNSVMPAGSDWDERGFTEKNINITRASAQQSYVTNLSGTVSYMTSDHYKLLLPSDYEGSVKIDVSYGNNSGRMQVHTETVNGNLTIHYPITESNSTSSFVQSNINEDGINSIIIIISNVAESGDMSYYVKVTPMPLSETIDFDDSKRYMERATYLETGEEAIYNATFATTGSKLMQTFGNNDTIIEIYSQDNVLLSSDDDDGYGNNALIKYYVTAGVEYTIKVRFYSSASTGQIKFAITPAFNVYSSNSTGLNSYDDIHNINSSASEYRWTSYAQPIYTRVITYTPTSSGNYTFTIESDQNTYMYVIDPRSNEFLMNNIDFNDNSGEGDNPMLTLTLEKNIPYLIIYSDYNPGQVTEQYQLVVKITRN